MKVVGIYGQTNKWTHDHSISLSTDGTISQYIQLERITRKKFDNTLPDYLHKIDSDFSLSDDQTNIAFVNTFSLGSDFFKISNNEISNSDKSVFFKNDGVERPAVSKSTGRLFGKKKEVTIVPHELAHVFSCIPFYGEFLDNSLLVHIDGAASVSNSSVWYYKNNELQLVHYGKELHKTLMSFSYNDLAGYILGIPKENYKSLPGKLMGYSSFGNDNPQLLQWIRSNDLFLSFKHKSPSEIISEGVKFYGANTDLSIKSQLSMDIARAYQRNFEENLLKYIKKYQYQTGAANLYYSGGAALNIKFNSILVKSQVFERVFIPPPAGDSGLSIGASSYLNWELGIRNKKASVYLNNYLIDEWKYDPNFSIDDICKLLSKGNVIGVRTGNAEAGPRALGHRSLLAIPEKKMFKKVSIEIKGREWYRPLAPIVLEENVDVIFEDNVVAPFAKYMLQEFKVRPEYHGVIPAVVHVDHTSRPQIVNRNDPNLTLIIDILRTMDEVYNYPCLINTSFNKAGEPIVHSVHDAKLSAKSMGLDGLIIDNYFYKRGEF